MTRDRVRDLLALGTLSGIDFVEIADQSETVLIVHFFTSAIPLAGTVTSVAITGGQTIPTVDVLPIAPADWGVDAFGRTTLTLRVAAPGDFSQYTLTIESALLDDYFDHVSFSFKALCPRDIDCETPPEAIPTDDVDVPPIDYLAKDYESFKRALLDFSALRYPAWRERSEADFGVMFLEALSAIGDDLSYQQDRHAAQAYLDTASERRSIVRHARLVDYEPRPATASRVLLRFTVVSGPIPAGLIVHATSADGAPIDFETGTGLDDTTDYDVRVEWNQLAAHVFDDAARIARRGATEIWVVGLPGFLDGQELLVETETKPADPPLRQLVTVASTSTQHDAVYGVDVTRIVFLEPLGRDRDLTKTKVYGNLVPASQGRRANDAFAIENGPRGVPLAVVRRGPNGTSQYLHSLASAPLAYLATDDGGVRPEIRLTNTQGPVRWRWVRTLIDAEPFPMRPLFTVDPMRFSPVGAPDADLRRAFDYDGSDGATIRFGDGVFGDVPDPGGTFIVEYRIGGGEIGNVAADSITNIDPTSLLASRASAVTNPFPATGGADAETNETVRRLAPEAFRAKQFRAVRAEDYARAAETLPWVQRAGATFRYTGSWLTAFTSIDPKGTEVLAEDRSREVEALLDRYRMTGYESHVLPPRFVSLDLVVTVCARPDAFRGDVHEAVTDALSAREGGFFHPDRFVFGQPLDRSQLAAAIQNAHGVDGVLEIRYRRRGSTKNYVKLISRVSVGSNEIVRADSDPNRPDAGSVTVVVRGGK